MDIFGIGPLEFFFIVLLIIIIFGPKDIQKASKTVGQGLRKLVQSDTWKTVSQASRKIKTLPNDLMREAGIDEIQKTIAPIQSELKKVNAAARKPVGSGLIETWTVDTPTPPADEPSAPPSPPPSPPEEHKE